MHRKCLCSYCTLLDALSLRLVIFSHDYFVARSVVFSFSLCFCTQYYSKSCVMIGLYTCPLSIISWHLMSCFPLYTHALIFFLLYGLRIRCFFCCYLFLFFVVVALFTIIMSLFICNVVGNISYDGFLDI